MGCKDDGGRRLREALAESRLSKPQPLRGALTVHDATGERDA
jgi:hypothetical protein